MQAPAKPIVIPAPGVVFDCDMGNGVDDVLALAVLYGLDTKNEARVVSVSVTKANLKSAVLCDAMMRFYASGGTGKAPAFMRTLPVGFAETGVSPEDTKVLSAVLAKKDAEGQPAFSTSVKVLNDTAECSALIRNALTAQHDNNAVVVLTGPATNLAKVLVVHDAKDLIRRKVRRLVMACGMYPNGEPEFNVATDVAAANMVLAEWPSDLIACGREIGELVQYPGASIDADFPWATSHPVIEAYRAHKPMPYDAAAVEAISALCALRPDAPFFKLSEPGRIQIREDGGTEFVPSANGKHRYLTVDPTQKDAAVKALVELVTTRPVVRRPRFPQVQQMPEVKKPEVPKPPSSSKP